MFKSVPPFLSLGRRKPALSISHRALARSGGLTAAVPASTRRACVSDPDRSSSFACHAEAERRRVVRHSAFAEPISSPVPPKQFPRATALRPLDSTTQTPVTDGHGNWSPQTPIRKQLETTK